MVRLLCCTISLAWTWSLGMFNLYGVMSLVQLEMTYTLRHCMCFRPCILRSRCPCAVLWECLPRWVKSIWMKVWMFKLSQLSKFLHGRQRKKFWYLLSKFQTKSRVNTSVASLFQTTVVTAFKLQGASEDKSFPGFLTAGSIASIYVHK